MVISSVTPGLDVIMDEHPAPVIYILLVFVTYQSQLCFHLLGSAPVQ